jgi:hypothetical protein
MKQGECQARAVQERPAEDCSATLNHEPLVSDGVEFSTFALLREQDLGHHALVLVIQQMTMEYGHALDDGVGRVQDDIN